MSLAVLLLILAGGIGLRAFRIDWGLPGYVFPDAAVHFIHPAIVAAGGGSLSPPEFVHPPLVFLLLTAVFRLWSAVTGTPIVASAAFASGQIWTLTLVGRAAMVALAGLSLLVLHAVARRLAGPRAALFAAACFAFAPLHVLESHRIAPDVPMILLALLAMQLALAAAARGRAAWLLGAFGFAGFAAATKYTGVFAAGVPAWVAFGFGRRRALLLLGGGGLAALGSFSLGCVPCFCNFDRFQRGVRLIGHFGYLAGMPGADLSGEWPQVRYVYPLVVALPYMVGWPVYLAGLAGLWLLWRRDRRAASVLLIAGVPYLLFMGGAISAVPRYYLLVCPLIAIAAGVCLARLWGAGGLGAALACAVIAYTALLSVSQVCRLGLGPQRDVGALVARLAADATRANRRLVVAYPNQFALAYDAVRPYLRAAGVRIVEFPEPYGHLGSERMGHTSPEGPPVLRADVVILPSWVENAVRRAGRDGPAARFFHQLEAGDLGFGLAGDFRRPYLTESLYTWGDAMLDTHWETAIAGYKVFVRPAVSDAEG